MRLTPLAGTAMPASGAMRALVDDVWERIARSLDGTWPAWSLPMLVTVSADGPRARVLALRAAHADKRTLVFHTDARSDKAREMEADARVSVVFWDPGDGVEARFTGRAELHRSDAVAYTAWQYASPLRRLASRTAAPPGAWLAGPSRMDALPAQPEGDGYPNFLLVNVVVTKLDWLWVGADDLRRASFAWTGVEWAGAWTVP